MPSKTEPQRRLFGIALSVKRGETPRSDVDEEVLKIVDSMSEEKLRKYAKSIKKEEKLRELIRNVLREQITEVAYDGNIGFHEMFLFYNKASSSQQNKLEKLISSEKFKDAWRLVQDVVGIELVGKQFNK